MGCIKVKLLTIMQTIPEKDLEFIQTLTNKKLQQTYTMKRDKDGAKYTVIHLPSNNNYWVKLFKKNSQNMELEYELQNKAAQQSAAPTLYWISTKERLIVGEYIPFKLLDRLHAHRQLKIPFQLQTQLYSLCKRLDIAGVYHNNGNISQIAMTTDLQLETGIPREPYPRLYITGFGHATSMSRDDINMKKTLFNLTRTLGYNKIRSSGLYKMYSDFVTEGINRNVMTYGDNILPSRTLWETNRQTPKQPRGLERAPRSAPRPPRSAPRAPRSAPRPPRSGPRAPRSGPRPPGPRAPGPRAPRGGPRAPRGRRVKPPPRNFRVHSLKDVKKTVFEGSDLDCCDFEDLTARLSTKNPSKKKTVPKKKKKKVLFEFNSVGDEAAIRKFCKHSNIKFLQTLSLDGIENVNLTLNLLSKLWSQYKKKKKEDKEWGQKVEEETPTEEAWILVQELIQIPLIEERIQVLKFKHLLHHDFLSISHTIELIHTNIKHVYTSIKLKQLLQIIVQAINQRLKDFAETEKADFKDYERIGVPTHDIITFMTQKTPMNIIAEKVLESGLDLDTLDLGGLDQVRGEQITDQVLVPLKRLGEEFAKIQKLKINISNYIKSASEQLSSLETKSDAMVEYLQKTSLYLGEDGNYLKIKDSKGAIKYNIISLVQTISKLWYAACKRAKKIIQQREKPESNKINEMMKQAMASRRSSLTDNEARKWD